MTSEDHAFWDQRYRTEGAIWGASPSPTAVLATRYLPAQAQVLDVGFGYGRDLAYLCRQGCRVYGIDLSAEGRGRAESWFRQEGLRVEALWTGRFEDAVLPDGAFDVLLSHRMAHLLTTAEEIAHFAAKVRRVLRPGGLLCLGARNLDDLNPAGMVPVDAYVYEYADRPGHRISYWDDAAFQETFGEAFEALSLTRATEPESALRPVPCHLTVMVARKKDGTKATPLGLDG